MCIHLCMYVYPPVWKFLADVDLFLNSILLTEVETLSEQEQVSSLLV